jgi:hypothetical protein
VYGLCCCLLKVKVVVATAVLKNDAVVVAIAVFKAATVSSQLPLEL